MGARLEDSVFSELTEEEEREVLVRQRARNRVLGLVLGAIVVVILLFSFVMMVRTGFVPFQDQDIFRSS